MTIRRSHLSAIAIGVLVAACAGQGPVTPPGSAAATTAPAPASTASATPAVSPTMAPRATPAPAIAPSPSADVVRNPAPYVEGAPYAYEVDPAAFGRVIDNPYLPLVPGTVSVFRGGDERIVVEVLAETRDILGVATTVVHDQAFVGGELAEDTYDWYAQDLDGNVWYFGEATRELDNGKVTSTAGSWEAGVDGAVPGVVMLADPRVGDLYRQEYAKGEAEDVAKVIAVDGSIEVRAGAYGATITTEDWSPLEPSLVEHKTYAPGIGVVHEEVVKGGHDTMELVRIRRP